MRIREAEFERKLAQTGLWQLPDLLQTLPDETARLARLCYAASPASDWLDTPPEVFFSCAAHARYLRENVSWTRALPEPLFLAYVLHPRVNNEALCDCRPVFYAALAERLRGLPEEAAILEINRWCAEHVAYQPTDERTRSALAVLRAGFGRCGEESMFAVNVLRACGFAARGTSSGPVSRRPCWTAAGSTARPDAPFWCTAAASASRSRVRISSAARAMWSIATKRPVMPMCAA